MKKVFLRSLAAALVLSVLLLSLCGCTNGGTTEDDKTTSATSAASDDINSAGDKALEGDSDHQRVKFTMKNGGSFTVELYPEYAPETVENFLSLVNDGFYNGLTFHRIVDNFMAQGGSASGDGRSVSGETTIHGEFKNNGFEQNTLKHERGVISMARNGMDYDSASTQFFICYAEQSMLDGDYAAFGKVVEGMETVDSFTKVERSVNSMGEVATPVEPLVMEKVEVVK